MIFDKEYENSLKEKALIEAEKNTRYDEENQNIMDPLNEIFEQFEQFDWSYEKSDCHNTWERGQKSLTKIQKLVADHLANNIEDKKTITQKAIEIQGSRFKSQYLPFSVNRFFQKVKP